MRGPVHLRDATRGIAAAVLGERPTIWHLVGGALILGGVALGNTPSRRTIPAEG
jgi:drug/metabolite transporter (DMT)-like permease